MHVRVFTDDPMTKPYNPTRSVMSCVPYYYRLLTVALVVTHTGLVSLPVPVVGHIPGYETAHSLHVPVKRFTGTTSALVTVHSLHVTVPLVH